MESVNFLLYSIIFIASVFGIYVSIRLLRLWSSHCFYIVWLASYSITLLLFFFVKNGTFNTYSFLYRVFSPLFAIGPGLLYLFILSINEVKKPKRVLILHMLPVIILLPITIVLIGFYTPNQSTAADGFQLQTLFSHYMPQESSYQIEKILFFVRTLLGIIYIRLISKVLPKNANNVITDRLWQLFEPTRKQVLFVVTIFVVYQIIGCFPNVSLTTNYGVNAIFLLASGTLLWHLLLILQDLENPNSSFRKNPKDVAAQLTMSKESQFILHQIYTQKLYLDRVLTVEKAAQTLDITEEKFTTEFSNNIPFSFSSYINYLRLAYFDKEANNKFSKEANIANAGFNNRMSYYLWERRKDNLALQIDPVLKHLLQKT